MSDKVVLYHRATGQRLERWSVDARAMLATGAYSTTPPGDPEAAPAPPAPVSAPLSIDAAGQVSGEHPTGALPVVTQAHEAPAAKPVTIEPERRARRSKAV